MAFFRELKSTAKTKGHRVTKMSPQTLIFSDSNKDGHPFLA